MRGLGDAPMSRYEAAREARYIKTDTKSFICECKCEFTVDASECQRIDCYGQAHSFYKCACPQCGRDCDCG